MSQWKIEAGSDKAGNFCAHGPTLGSAGTVRLLVLFPARRLSAPSLLALLACTVALFITTERSEAASFTGLGFLNGDSIQSSAAAISADGATAVGYNLDPVAPAIEAFSWNSGSMTGLGFIPGGSFQSLAGGVSGDGSVVVGVSDNGSSTEAFRWTSGPGMVGLGTLGGSTSTARAVSVDGTTIVGASDNVGAAPEAFIWKSGPGMTGLGYLTGGGTQSFANGVSGDGTVIVGVSDISPTTNEAFRWTVGSGMVSLGTLGLGGANSTANGISADGSTIVGVSDNLLGDTEAFMWTSGPGMVGLGDLTGGSFLSVAQAVNADGTVIVGYSDAGGDTAFFWDSVHGMRSIQQYLIDQGLGAALTDWTLTKAFGISADGLKVVGEGVDPNGFTQAWYADLSPASVPEPGSFSLAALGLLLFTAGGLTRYRSVGK